MHNSATGECHICQYKGYDICIGYLSRCESVLICMVVWECQENELNVLQIRLEYYYTGHHQTDSTFSLCSNNSFRSFIWFLKHPAESYLLHRRYSQEYEHCFFLWSHSLIISSYVTEIQRISLQMAQIRCVNRRCRTINHTTTL